MPKHVTRVKVRYVEVVFDSQTNYTSNGLRIFALKCTNFSFNKGT